MNARALTILPVSLLLGLLLIGCNAGQSQSPPINNPVPSINSLSPSAVLAGGQSFSLTVNGSNFVSTSVVQWNGSNRTTTFVSTTRLTAVIPASDVAVAGTANVTVVSPTPGGGTSSASPVMITASPGNPVPAILSLSDSQAPAGWPGFALTLTGSGFVAASIAQWNGLNRPTTILSSTQLRASIPPEDLAAAGTAQVTVVNASPGGGTSNTFDFTIYLVPPNAVGVIVRASEGEDFVSADNDNWTPGISADGRYVAFASAATNLVPGDTNNAADIFMRDTCQGAPAGCTPSLIRVSVDSLDNEAGAGSQSPAISADGRYVAFSSYAANLVPGDTNDVRDIFIRDTCVGVPPGCTPATIRISVNSAETESDGDSYWPSISADGRFVAFQSDASNLVASDTNNASDVFVHDTCFGAGTGCMPQTIRVSLADDGSEANGYSYTPSISGDGRFMAFVSDASNLVANDANVVSDIFVRDTCVGAPSGCTPSTRRVSLDNTDGEANDASFLAAISSNSRFAAFTSWATNLVAGDTNGGHDVFLRDTCIGAPAGCTSSTIRVSVASDGSEADAPSGGPAAGGASLSADGRFVAFGSRATNLVSGDTNGTFDIFVRDTCLGVPAGCTPSIVRVSVALNGTEGNDRSDVPRINADGRFVAFQSYATRLAPGDGSSVLDVFVARTGKP